MRLLCFNIIRVLVCVFVINPLQSISAKKVEEINWTETNILLLEKHILPGYQKLAQATRVLHGSVLLHDDVCFNLKEEQRKLLKQNFEELFKQWANIQHVRIGPITYLERIDRFHYWPDKHNSGARQIAKFLQEGPSLALEELQQKSVALQGISALERLFVNVFDENIALKNKKKSCELIKLITENLQEITTETNKAWLSPPVEFEKEFILAEKSVGVFNSSADLSKQLLNGIRTQLAIIERLKLGRAIDLADKKDEKSQLVQRIRPKRLEAWRNRLSLALIAANVDAIKQVYKLAYAKHLKQYDEGLHQKIDYEFQSIKLILKDIKRPLYEILQEQQLGQANEFSKVLELMHHVERLYQMIGNELPKQLGLNIAFNALDGD